MNMKRFVPYVLCLFLLSNVAVADEYKLVVKVSDTVGILITSSTPLTVKTERVPLQDIGGEIPDDPTEPDDPTDPPTLDDTAKEAKRLAEQVEGDTQATSTAIGLAAIYDGVANEIKDGKMDGLTVSQISQGVSFGTTMFLTQQRAVRAWKPWRDGISDELIRLTDLGQLSSPQDYAKAAQSIADGLQSFAGNPSNAEKAQMLDLTKIIEIILAILEFLRQFLS